MRDWRAGMAYAKGEVVKQGHVDYCEANGHAVHVAEGVRQGRCPRCGEVPSAPAPELPYRPSVGTPAGWSSIAAPEV